MNNKRSASNRTTPKFMKNNLVHSLLCCSVALAAILTYYGWNVPNALKYGSACLVGALIGFVFLRRGDHKKRAREQTSAAVAKGADIGAQVDFCSIGELIHGLGTSLSDGRSSIGSLSRQDGLILGEVGHALRMSPRGDADAAALFPHCLAAGFNPREYSTSQLLDIATRVIGNEGVVSFRDAIVSVGQPSGNAR